MTLYCHGVSMEAILSWSYALRLAGRNQGFRSAHRRIHGRRQHGPNEWSDHKEPELGERPAPDKQRWPMLRAGFTNVLVTGIPSRWIKTSTKPIGIPAKPTGALMSVAPRTVRIRKAVRTISAIKAAPRL